MDLNKIIRKMSWIDMALLKTATFFFALTLVHFLPNLLDVDWRIYGVLFVVPWTYLVYKIWIKK